RPKLVCGVATKCSATRLPTSCGDVPAGHFEKSAIAFFDCASLMPGSNCAIPSASNKPGIVFFMYSRLFFLQCFYFNFAVINFRTFRLYEQPARAQTGIGTFINHHTI